MKGTIKINFRIFFYVGNFHHISKTPCLKKKLSAGRPIGRTGFPIGLISFLIELTGFPIRLTGFTIGLTVFSIELSGFLIQLFLQDRAYWQINFW